MAKAFRCDRCGEHEDGEPVAGVTFIQPDPGSNTGAKRTIPKELCLDCLAKLHDWMRDGSPLAEGIEP